MSKNVLFRQIAFCLCAMALACGLSSCNVFKKGARAQTNTLMVTGNFLKPRLLCELAQFYTHQPFMVFQPMAAGAEAPQGIYYCSPNNRAEQIPPEDFTEMLAFLNPKVVVFLGGNECVPQQYVELARQKYRVVTLSSLDWELNAQLLGQLLGQDDRLVKTFNEYLKKYQTLPGQDKLAPPAAAEPNAQ